MSNTMPAPTPRRKTKTKPKPTVSVTKGNIETGDYTTTTRTPGVAQESEEIVKDKAYYQNKYGYSTALLKANESLKQLINDAVKNEYTDEEFWYAYNNTQFAQDRNKAQEEYDIAMSGPNADTYTEKVKAQAARLEQMASRLGIQLSAEEVQQQAQFIVRNGVENEASLAYDQFFAKKYEEKTGTAANGGVPQLAGQSGTAGNIQAQLRRQAASYGITLDDAALQRKTGEALGQGERWQEWVTSQEGIYRQQAKLLYPNAAHLFDTQSLEQIAEPYMQVAARALGVSSADMDITDPKWTQFLNGDGRVLDSDEWTRVLMTDPKYGWDKTTKARNEYATLGDQLLSAFGMA